MTGAAKESMPAGTTAGTPQILLAHHLKHLKLPTVLREYDKVARECARDGVDHPRYLLRLVELELIDRERRMVERRIKAAKFPTTKSLDSFDFKAIPNLNKHCGAHTDILFAKYSDMFDGRTIMDFLFRTAREGNVQSFFDFYHTYLHYFNGKKLGLVFRLLAFAAHPVIGMTVRQSHH